MAADKQINNLGEVIEVMEQSALMPSGYQKPILEVLKKTFMELADLRDKNSRLRHANQHMQQQLGFLRK